MSNKGKRRMAILLAAAMLSACFTGTSLAKQEKAAGWRQEAGEWSYYEPSGEMRKNDFAISGTGVKGRYTMYWLDEDGHLRDEGGTVEAADGNSYEINVGGAVKGGQLYGGDDQWGRWYTEPSTGELTCNIWWQIHDGDGLYWYYFDKDDEIGSALQNCFRRIDETMYHFDELGRMSESKDINWDGGKDYEAQDPLYVLRAQMFGDIAENKWLYLDGGWRYFKLAEVFDYDTKFGVMVTDETLKLNGKEYEFDSDGYLVSDNAPYGAVDSIEITVDHDEVSIGGKATITADINVEVASPSDAARPVASMSNAEKNALSDGKAYDAGVRLTKNGKWAGDYPLELKDGKLRCTVTKPFKSEGDFSVSVIIDDVHSDEITISCIRDESKADDPKYMKDVLEGILDSGSAGDEIVDQLKTEFQSMQPETVQKLKDDDSFVGKLREFETLYRSNQGINRYEQNLIEIAPLVDVSAISIVGAFLNSDASDPEPVVVSMRRAAAVGGMSGIEGSKIVALDIGLSGGGIDSSNLEIPVIITMPVPKGISKNGLKLYHIHDGVPTEVNLSGSLLAQGKVRFATNSFSTFVFAGNPASLGSADSGSGSSSEKAVKTIPETPGAWKQTDAGWQFLNQDGLLYTNEWIYAKGKWYWVDAAGLMVQGWRQVKDRWYYFTPATGEMVIGWVADQGVWYYTDAAGARVSGWQQVNQKWYYFGENGAMLADANTPDGYHVGADGAWVQ